MNQSPTTLRNIDPAFPGENWFFYWKTSASLWRQKLTECPVGPIIIPINWAFHTDTGENFDFGANKPEANLAQLVSLGEMLGRELIFFLPITPVPFLPNGGVPHLLARIPSLNTDGMAYAILDSEGRINRLISFFDSRVYQAYRKFVSALGRYLSEGGVACNVWGLEAGYLKNRRFVGFIEDRSSAFSQAFTRYVAVAREEKKALAQEQQGEASVQDEVFTPREEKKLKLKFTHIISDLYRESAHEALAGHYEGQMRVGFLGGTQEDFFRRHVGADDWYVHSRSIMEFTCRDVLTSSVLIPKTQATVLERQLSEVVTTTLLPLKLSGATYDLEEEAVWQPLSLFEIFERNVPGEENNHCWKNFGLFDYLDKDHRWNYRVQPADEFVMNEHRVQPKSLYFFHGENLDQAKLTHLLKVFMSGGNIILNRSRIGVPEQKRLEAFFLENNLEIEKVSFYTTIHNIKLGDGRFLVFEGERLEELDPDKRIVFWHDLLATFNIPHVEIKGEEGLEYSWRQRSALANELHYEEVRRFSIYNPTSYKKRMVVEIPRNLALIKLLDETHVQTTTRPGSMMLEFLPQGSITLDFGLFP